MASVRKRPWTYKGVTKEKWVVDYTDQSGKRRMRTADSKKEADALRRSIEAEIEKGVHVADGATMTVQEAGELWFRDCERRSAIGQMPRISTLRTYRVSLGRHIYPRFGRVLLTRIDPDEVTRWLEDQCLSGKAYGGVERNRIVLTQVIKFCIRKKLLGRNVLAEHAVVTPGQQVPVVLPTIQEVGQILEASSKRWPHEQLTTTLRRSLFIRLAAFSAMRAGEVSGLHWEAIDWHLGAITVRQSYSGVNGLKGPKTDAGKRSVQIVSPVHTALVELWEHVGRPLAGPVFISRTGKLLGGSALHLTYWRPTLKRAGLLRADGSPPFHLHSLRHMAVSLLLANGVDMLSVSRFVGHRKVSTTLDVYGHLLPSDDRIAAAMNGIADRLDAATARQKLLTD